MSDLNKIEVVPIKLERHPDADSLSIVTVFDGYTVVVRTDDWEHFTQAAYIPPDNIVDITRPEFSFLENPRIKARKLRGVMSQGLLVPVPDTFKIGDDVTEYLGVTRYVPPADVEMSGDAEAGPPRPPKYDIESWFKYKRVLNDGECVVITEKLHGTNASYTYQNGRMWVSSRSMYRKYNEHNVYWRALKENPWIEELCKNMPGVFLYGEIFGWVQNLKYDCKQGELKFRAFDIYDARERLQGDIYGYYLDDYQFSSLVEFYSKSDTSIVPTLYMGPYSEQIVLDNVSGKSTIASHIREGVVIKPVNERYDHKVGRVILKAVSPEYLAKEK